MKKKKSRISIEKKAQIITKILRPGSVAAEVARLHDISPKTVYGWLKKHKDSTALETKVNNSNKQFVELLVKEPINYSKESSLQKASLTFEDFSISIEGKLGSGKFISILKILEGTC